MACMCGDTHCWSCGPAQGNTRCPICGTWADDGCIHISEKTGKLKRKFEAEAKRIDEAEARREERMAAEFVEEKRLADAYFKGKEANQ